MIPVRILFSGVTVLPLGRVSKERQTCSRDLWRFPLCPGAAPKRDWSDQGWGAVSQRAAQSALISLELIPTGEGFPWSCISEGLSWERTRCVTALQIFIFPPNLMLIVIKTKQFPSPSSLHRAGILATCPVVHNQPKPRWFSKILLIGAFWVCPAQSSGFNTGVAGAASETQPVTIRVWISSALSNSTVSSSQGAKNNLELSVGKEKIPNNIFVIMSSVAFYSRGKKINIYIIC